VTPSGSRKPNRRPMSARTSTPGVPSAFMTTADHAPCSLFHSRV
jgi:hypothetical protein